jgi:Glycosyltransferase family 87
VWWLVVRPFVVSVASVLIVAWTAWWYLFGYLTADAHHYLDFGRFFYAARLWRAGGSLYGASVATWLQLDQEGVHLWNLNPPHVSLIFLPLSYLRVESAYGVWFLLTALCLFLSARIVVRSLGLKLQSSHRVLVLAAFLVGTPSLVFVSTGNITGPITLLTTLLWSDWRRERWMRVGCYLGMACSAKAFFLPILLYLGLTKRWRASSVAVVTGLLWLAVGGYVFGWSELRYWIKSVSEIQWPWLMINASLVAPLTRVAYVLGGWSISASGMQTALTIGASLSIAVSLFGVWVAARDSDVDRACLLLFLTCLLASPLGWIYYWWMLIGPLVSCYPRHITIRRAAWMSLPGWLIPPAFLWPWPSVMFALTIGSIYFWSLLALWIGTVQSSLAPIKIEQAARP